MKPAVQVQNVEKEVNQSNESCPPLPRVPPVATELVLTAVGSPGSRNPNANHGVKDERQEYRSPLDQWQQFSGAVNEKYSPLERFGTVEQTRIGREVNRHVQAERNNAQQGVNSPDEKLMAKKKTCLGSRLRAHLRVLTG